MTYVAMPAGDLVRGWHVLVPSEGWLKIAVVEDSEARPGYVMIRTENGPSIYLHITDYYMTATPRHRKCPDCFGTGFRYMETVLSSYQRTSCPSCGPGGVPSRRSIGWIE
jgi:hypothetical protein